MLHGLNGNVADLVPVRIEKGGQVDGFAGVSTNSSGVHVGEMSPGLVPGGEELGCGGYRRIRRKEDVQLGCGLNEDMAVSDGGCGERLSLKLRGADHPAPLEVRFTT